MKCLVFSDSHGHLEYMRKAVETEKPDKVLFLGDVLRDIRRLREDYPELDMEWVRGNCDGYGGEDPEEKELFLSGRRVWMLHGHTYRVKLGIGLLLSEARTRGEDVVLFGHTHLPLCDRQGKMWVMNPGTCSGMGQATYGVIETAGEELNCRIVELKPSTVGSRRWSF